MRIRAAVKKCGATTKRADFTPVETALARMSLAQKENPGVSTGVSSNQSG
jgi:hypothetical protein